MRPLLSLLLLLSACAGPRPAPPAGAAPPLGDDWFAHRAAELGMSVAEARARDAALPVDQPPEPDARLAAHGAALWSALCARCHGEDGEPPEDPSLDPPPRTWGGLGASMGFFFGGDRMRAGIYKKIAEGGPEREGRASSMVAWRESLAREQIWALVRHLEAL